MSKQIELKSINNKPFHIEISEPNEISVLEGGYIITPEGHFIPVKDNEEHADKFTDYLVQYLEDIKFKKLNSIEAARLLTELGHIVYFGLKMNDNKNIFIENSSNPEGYAILIIPDNSDTITNDQKEATITLLNTNKSIFGNHPILELQCHTFSQEQSITEEELRTLCTKLGNNHQK